MKFFIERNKAYKLNLIFVHEEFAIFVVNKHLIVFKGYPGPDGLPGTDGAPGARVCTQALFVCYINLF